MQQDVIYWFKASINCLRETFQLLCIIFLVITGVLYSSFSIAASMENCGNTLVCEPATKNPPRFKVFAEAAVSNPQLPIETGVIAGVSVSSGFLSFQEARAEIEKFRSYVMVQIDGCLIEQYSQTAESVSSWLLSSGLGGPTTIQRYFEFNYTQREGAPSFECNENSRIAKARIDEFRSYSCPAHLPRTFFDFGQDQYICYENLCSGLDFSRYPDRPTTNTVRWFRDGFCPKEYEQFESCQATGKFPDAKGNPIACLTGEKIQSETDFQSPANSDLKFSRHYSSQPVANIRPEKPEPLWSIGSDVEFKILEQASYGMIAELRFGDGGRLLFTATSNTSTSLNASTGAHGKLKLVNGSWEWAKLNGTKYTFGNFGKPSKSVGVGGQTLHYEWTDIGGGNIRLTGLTDYVGRTIRVTYSSSGDLLTMTTPDNQVYRYEYDVLGNLSGVVYPDDTPSNHFDNPKKQYLYEDARFPRHLTGTIDENGNRYATWAYDAQGRGVLSAHANGANKVTFEYLANGETIVQYHLNEKTYREQLRVIDKAHGHDRVKRLEDYPCLGCGVGSVVNEYNSNGWLTKTIDRNGVVTTFGRDTSGRETSRTEALNTAEARTISTSWNATWNLPSQITEGSHRQIFSYNSQGLLTQKTDTDTATNKNLITKYTYDTVGLLTKVDGPRTDATDITNYAYDSQGNLITVTNALGHITTLSNYDANGRVGQITDPNDLVNTLTYTARGWLKTRTVGSQTTTFDYDKVGQLTKVTMPDGSYIRYEYDAAHRLIAIENPLGERIEYTLDYAGNRTKEEIKDASGNVVLRRASEFNALNQLLRSLNAANQVTASYSYDANGNMTGVTRYTDSETASSSYQYDPLNRLKSITDALNGITQFSYDNLDQLNRVTDPKGLQTQYGVSALGELKQTDSPDTATSTQTFDSAGNVKTSTNARGHTTTYTYDALNRVTKLTYHDGSVVTFAYDSIVAGNYGKGRLTSVTDSSGSTQYRYDQYGRLTEKLATVNGVSFSTSYRYDQYGRLESITYPSGRDLSFSYQNGQLQQLNVDGSARLKNIAYQPFSAVKSWQWGDNSDYQRTFNLDGQLQSFPLGADVVTLSYDRAGRISAQTHAHTASRNQSYYYDLLDRVTGSSGAFEMSFSFDANGNRLSKTEGSAFDQYTVSETSNRIDTISGALNRSYQYDAAGNTLSDGDRSYTYNTANRLTTITKGSVTQDNLYNGLGQRVLKTVDGVSTLFIYDEAGHLIGEYDAAGTPLMEVVYLGDQPILAMKPSGVYYVHADHLNTPRAIIGANQTVIWRWDSAAFGETAANEDPDGNGLAFRFNHRFPGQVMDVEVGLHYNYFRNYDPITGRYIESDPIGLAGGINTYGYVGASPLNFIDPFGLDAAVVSPGIFNPAVPRPMVSPIRPPGPWIYLLPLPVGEGSDVVPRTSSFAESLQNAERCDSDDDCAKLYQQINGLVALLKKRYADMRLDKMDLFTNRPTGVMSWFGHIQQFRQVQATLRKVLTMADSKGCKGYDPDAWDWATTPPPVRPAPRW